MFERNLSYPVLFGGCVHLEMFGGMSSVGKCLDEFLQKAQKPRQSAYALHIRTLLYQGVVPSTHFS